MKSSERKQQTWGYAMTDVLSGSSVPRVAVTKNPPWFLGDYVATKAGWIGPEVNTFMHAYLSAAYALVNGSTASFRLGESIEWTDTRSHATAAPTADRLVDTYRDALFDHLGLLTAKVVSAPGSGMPAQFQAMKDILLDFIGSGWIGSSADAMPPAWTLGNNPFYDYWDRGAQATVERFIQYCAHNGIGSVRPRC